MATGCNTAVSHGKPCSPRLPGENTPRAVRGVCFFNFGRPRAKRVGFYERKIVELSDAEKLGRALETSRNALMSELITNKTLNDPQLSALRDKIDELKTEIGSIIDEAMHEIAKIEG